MSFGERLVYLLCDPARAEELAGDVVELAQRRVSRVGRIRARILQAVDVLSVCVRQSRLRTADPYLLGIGLAAVALSLAATWGGAVGPGSFSVDAMDPAGQFTIQVERGRVTAATLDGVPIRAERLRQAGKELVIVGGDGDRDLAIELTRGGIRWDARRSRGNRTGPACPSNDEPAP